MSKFDGLKKLNELVDIVGKVKELAQEEGIVERRVSAEVNGKKGFLVWDYILYNEISFQAEGYKDITFFQSFSDKKTELEWDKLVEKYGI